MTTIEPTYSTDEVVQLMAGIRTDRWVRQMAARKDIGRGRPKRFTRRDVAALRKLADPEETRGRPRL
jgi:hypothetical protein